MFHLKGARRRQRRWPDGHQRVLHRLQADHEQAQGRRDPEGVAAQLDRRYGPGYADDAAGNADASR